MIYNIKKPIAYWLCRAAAICTVIQELQYIERNTHSFTLWRFDLPLALCLCMDSVFRDAKGFRNEKSRIINRVSGLKCNWIAVQTSFRAVSTCRNVYTIKINWISVSLSVGIIRRRQRLPLFLCMELCRLTRCGMYVAKICFFGERLIMIPATLCNVGINWQFLNYGRCVP